MMMSMILRFLSLFILISVVFLIPKLYYQATFTLEEVDGAPKHTWRLLYSPRANALFVATCNGTVHKFDGENWQLVLDTKMNRYCFLNLDSYENIYVSTLDKLYRSADDGKTWALVFERPVALWRFRIWHIADLENGTLLADNWVHQGPYLWRSNDCGETWYLWKNFTEIFPQYAKPSPTIEGALLLRHFHLIAYDKYAKKIIVAAGDDVKHLFITFDGETWEEVEYGGFHNAMIFEDKILYFPSHGYGITVYDKDTDTYRIVYRKFGTSEVIRIDDFVYDPETGITYAGVIERNYGIICSLDKGETWTTMYRMEAADHVLVFLSIFHDYLYISMGYENYGKIYRVPLSAKTITIKEDINRDCEVNIVDLAIAAVAFGSHGPDIPNPSDPPSEGWYPDADVNNDGVVNIIDIARVSTKFGWSC